MRELLVSLLLIALAAAVGWFAMLKMRSGRYDRLVSLARAGDTASFEACLADSVSRMFISPYAKGRLYLILAQAHGDAKEVREAVNQLMRLKLSVQQRLSVEMEAFSMLVCMGDVKGCARLLEDIEGAAAPEVAAGYRCYFDTAVLGLGVHEAELERRLERLEGTPARKTRGHVEYLLSIAYASNGKAAQGEALRKRAADDLEVNDEQLEGSIDVSACL